MLYGVCCVYMGVSVLEHFKQTSSNYQSCMLFVVYTWILEHLKQLSNMCIGCKASWRSEGHESCGLSLAVQNFDTYPCTSPKVW
jgi:hypothetical protein